ncbi:MAG TPA: hypothetical protein VHY83_00125 [Solirubrobacteraceae bacterium]|nr:hypothetical protein [Solirubrobacteraceae bacterium]
MSVLIAILTLALVAVVVLVVSAPLRSAMRRAPGSSAASRGTRAVARAELEAALEATELEAAREAKYREIRDAELDFRTGKLSREDYDAIDGELRAEAIEILNRLEQGER